MGVEGSGYQEHSPVLHCGHPPERQESSLASLAGLVRRAEHRAKLASQTTPVAKLLISVRSPSEMYLRNVLNNTCLWEWKVLTNPGKRKELNCKWVMKVALTTTREHVSLQRLRQNFCENYRER